MKKVIVVMVLFTGLYSCNSGGNNSDTAGDTTGSNMSAVPNVNGNIPDTTNSISLDDDTKDTTGMAMDSMRKK